MTAPALVHDYLLVRRGAERSFAGLAECWREAPIYTIAYDDRRVTDFRGRRVVTSPLQSLRPTQRNFRWMLPACPAAVERLPLHEHAVVISSSSSFAHGVRCRPDAVHICWCHIPFRYAWCQADARNATPKALWPAARVMLERIRRWDLAASQRVTHYLTNGRLSQRRIEQVYGRHADIVYPPVDVERFSIGEPEDYFLVVGELVEHKAVDLALRAARLADARIKVVGGGPERRRLQALYAGSKAEFLGRIGDRELERLYSGARALVMPQIEDFGIVSVEAQASGRPVLAADAGGARETVLPGVTGELVPAGDVGALAEAMRHVDFDRFTPAAARANAHRFSAERFREAFIRRVQLLTAATG